MAADNPGDLKAAQALWDTLWTLNRVDPDNVAGLDGAYAGDNTGSVLRNPELSMSPYAHVQAALLFSLTRLCDGSKERAQQALYGLHDSGEDVPYVLDYLRKEWAAQDATRDPVEEALAALFERTRSTEEYDALVWLVASAGLRWDCAACGATNAARKDVCEHCTTARPTS